jgi:hypothetical protein
MPCDLAGDDSHFALEPHVRRLRHLDDSTLPQFCLRVIERQREPIK